LGDRVVETAFLKRVAVDFTVFFATAFFATVFFATVFFADGLGFATVVFDTTFLFVFAWTFLAWVASLDFFAGEVTWPGDT
jgi:hypothetical protein